MWIYDYMLSLYNPTCACVNTCSYYHENNDYSHWTCLKTYRMKLLKTCIPTADNHHPLLNNEWSFMGALITLAFLSQASIFNHNQLILPVQLFRKTTGTFQFVSKCYFWGVNVSGICIIIHLLHFTFLPNDFNLH